MSDQSIELESVHARTSAVSKQHPTGTRVYHNEDLQHQSLGRSVGEEQSLPDDEAVLARFGKKQQLKRRFKSVSAIAFTCGLMTTWVGILGSLQFGLLSGGPAGLIYGYLGAFIGAMLQAVVLGEIASMIPISGGAFNWVAVLAPTPGSRRFLSYIAGWLTVIAYHVYVLAAAYGSASVIRGIVIMTHPTYEPRLWHATLITYAVAVFGFVINTYFGRILPHIEVALLIFFVMGYFGTLIPLVYLSPHRSASDVWGTFLNLGGWQTDGITFLIGWVASTGSFIGADAADHIGEEIKSAAAVIPLSMWTATLINGVMGFGILVAALYATPDFEAATSSDTGWAFLDIFRAALGSAGGAAGLAAIGTTANVLSITSLMATASRALWAFSRENGLPFSKFIARVDPKTRIPCNAVFVTLITTLLLSLISVGSAEAFRAFFSGQLATYYSVFLLSAGVMLHKRLTTPNDQIPWGPFKLGRFGVPITVISIVYTFVALFFSFFPGSLPVTAENMNYSILIYGAALLFMFGFWVVHGHSVYKGPIWEIDGGLVRKS